MVWLRFFMGGQDGNRGYLIQAVVALLSSLDDPNWQSVSLEPNISSDKVDILWISPSQTKATQVKSSINQINKPDATRWASDLKKATKAHIYELFLVGPSSKSVARLGTHGGVSIPCPKNLDIQGLLNEAAHLLDKFLTREGVVQTSATQREVMVSAIVTKLSAISTIGEILTRPQLVETLKEWAGAASPSAAVSWEQVSFAQQRGLDSAVAGHRLGPGDVDACPKLSICDDIIRELERSNLHQVVGQPGCGKSISAWHAAKHFNDAGFTIWRPGSSLDPGNLPNNLSVTKKVLLIVDDVQRFEPTLVERLSEAANDGLKILLISTVEHASLSTIVCVNPEKCVDELADAFLARREELLPVLQQYDDRLGDRYHETSIEDRILLARREKSPWAFFWYLRGGWQTANQELQTVKQFPFAVEVLALIAVGQVVSCDAGVTLDWLTESAKIAGITANEVKRASERLQQLKLLAQTDELRTKHLQYAFRILEKVFGHANKDLWPNLLMLCIEEFSNEARSLQGIAWLLDAVTRTDMFRLHSRTTLTSAKDILLRRATTETKDMDWAAGCFARVAAGFELLPDEVLQHREVLLQWITSGHGLRSHFCGSVINGLINDSKQGPFEDSARSFNSDVDVDRLVALANNLDHDDFYNFGWLLNRLAFYGPAWANEFIQEMDWPRLRATILTAPTDRAYAVDKIVYSICRLAEAAKSDSYAKHIEDVIPYFARAINQSPTTINEMHDVLWSCLGYVPKFLRGGHAPDAIQSGLAKKLVDALDPNAFAQVMNTTKPRDLENLARAFEVIYEIDEAFLIRVTNALSLGDFYSAARDDWKSQSSELQSLLLFFSIGKEMNPAADWIRANESIIDGPLVPELACIAPDVAVRFHRAGKGVELIDPGDADWSMCAIAISGMSTVDREACEELIMQNFQSFEEALYVLSLRSPVGIVRFFRALHKVSTSLYDQLMDRFDLNKAKPTETIKRLVSNQQNERDAYLKIARASCVFPGKAGELARSVGERIKKAQREHDLSKQSQPA